MFHEHVHVDVGVVEHGLVAGETWNKKRGTESLRVVDPEFADAAFPSARFLSGLLPAVQQSSPSCVGFGMNRIPGRHLKY